MTDQPFLPPTVSFEIQRCLDSLSYLIKYQDPKYVSLAIKTLVDHCRQLGINPTFSYASSYVNTIPVHLQPHYPGDLVLEKKIEDWVRWNAMAMVVKANQKDSSLGGHLASFASCSTLYEVGFNHFFKGNGNGYEADQVFFQGHTSPGNYARSYLEGRFDEKKLESFRRDLSPGGGLSSYPHPFLMPDYWQFPTVSMGLGPILSIYQARFNQYLKARGFLKQDVDQHVWCFIGDGECDEPETLGAITLASREHLDNLIFVINCNLQRLDGPVRGNGKIIQELDALFRGAGWHVIKVIWGSNWDPLLQSEHGELLIKRMEEVVDGDYQKYVVEPGSYFRKHFFGKYQELQTLVSHLTDDELKDLLRGGHDPIKVYSAYHAAVNHKGAPTVILAKTVKGFSLGDAGEGRNAAHQQKKMTEKNLRYYREKLQLPISDEEIAEMPFYRPSKDSQEYQYLIQKREALGGFLPERKHQVSSLSVPELSFFDEFLQSSNGSELSTTMSFVRLFSKLLKHPDIGSRVVPIIPDEARTFGMEPLFRQIGIYSPKGQLYQPVDQESLAAYIEKKDGQIFEEGINESGAMSTFIAAGTSYATHGYPMIPFFIYYSMFGFQRVGDLMWLAGDIQAKGFLLGATAGRTTLNGEGLQHQDGHSHLLASAIPNLAAYDPSFRYEIAVIVQDGLKRMYQDQESIFYYITLCNENYEMPAMPKGAEEGILKGLYKFKPSQHKGQHHVHLLGSGTIMLSVLKAQAILFEKFQISADVWSATSYKHLRHDAIHCRRFNMLHPDQKPKKSYLETLLEKEKGLFFAASDNMRIVPDQIAPFVPGGLFSLGTDGFGRSETRQALRRFFEVDAESIVLAVLYQLSQKGSLPVSVVKEAIVDLEIDPDKVYPYFI